MAFKHTCRECHGSFKSKHYSAEFCGAACRGAFNNRRARRGAVLYDLLMIEATNPEAFQRNRLDGVASAAIAAFKREDEIAGRKRSHKGLHDVMADTRIYQSR